MNSKVIEELIKINEEKNIKSIGDISDGYHSFDELYQYRLEYNAAFFNLIAEVRAFNPASMNADYKVWKSKKHADGTMFEGYFITGLETPEGNQIRNHYKMEEWDKFKVPVREFATEYKGGENLDSFKELF